MLSRWMLLIALGLRAPNDDGSVRQREDMLASALRTADGSTLLKLSDSQLHVAFQCGYAAKIITIAMSRDEWISTVTHAKTTAYQAKVTEVRSQTIHNEGVATADIVETMSLSSPKGAIEKRLSASDFWVNQDGAWKLTNRTYIQVCDDGPHLRFP